VFGSALREDFCPHSDLDLLVGFAPEADPSLLDHVAMEQELSGIVGRKVDLISQRAIERSSNWIRRKAILESTEPYFASRSSAPPRHFEGCASDRGVQGDGGEGRVPG
jgi:predicted nucleotidyltransferase